MINKYAIGCVNSRLISDKDKREFQLKMRRYEQLVMITRAVGIIENKYRLNKVVFSTTVLLFWS